MNSFLLNYFNIWGLITWRKGTGKDSSPADSGRDIEGILYKKDVDGTTYSEKWFIEVKQSLTGVGADKLNNAISWANAERPDVLLIIVSNFLSNPGKDYLETYENKNNPPFKIKYWELTDLERLTGNKLDLLKKFKVPSRNFPFINLLHPVHLEYIRNPPLNSLDYLFNVLDGADAKKRDNMFSFVTSSFLGLKEPTYENFKKRVLELSKQYYSQFLIESIINFTLAHIFNLGDKTSIPQFIKSQENIIKFAKLSQSGDINPNDYYSVNEDKLDSTTKKMVKESEERIKNAEKIFEDKYQDYIYLCENIVGPLFDQELLDVIKK